MDFRRPLAGADPAAIRDAFERRAVLLRAPPAERRHMVRTTVADAGRALAA